MATRMGALLLLLVAAASAVPIPREGETNCATRCPFGTKFGYEVGTTYTYHYTADIKTMMTGASEQHSSIKMSANAIIEVHSRCEFLLELSGVTLHDFSQDSEQPLEGSSQFAEQLQATRLHFGYADGEVISVCPDAEEQDWTLNIKRGVLATLQNTMEHLDEDIRTRELGLSGECDIDYHIEDGHITKTYDTRSCDNHHYYHSTMQAIKYATDAHIRVPDIFNMTHVCEQTLDEHNVFTHVMCRQVHLLNAFADGGNGATTEVVVTMDYQESSAGVSEHGDHVVEARESIRFHHENWNDHSHTHTNTAHEILQEICSNSEDHIWPLVPGLFMDLVQAMKRLDVAALTTLHGEAEGFCTKSRSFFYDALPNVKSIGSIQLIKNLISSGDIEDTMAEIWIDSLSFMEQTPTFEMLRTGRELLTMGTHSHSASMSVASMVHAYCRVHSDCEQEESVAAIILIFHDILQNSDNCHPSDEEQREAIFVALKSIGNMGVGEILMPALMHCVQNDNAPMALRVAATEAFRRFHCRHDTEQPLMLEVMQNRDYDPELRIKAYMELMRCPNEVIFADVRNMLAEEEINQVGSFIWTHLTNLMETSSPYKQEIRDLIQDESLVKAFDLDKRKFSRNYEWSYMHSEYDVGGQVDANLIWSPSSFAPRSAHLNLTTHMFGHSVNLLEVGGRIEGVEKVLENVFKDKNFNEILDNDYSTSQMTQSMEETRAQVFLRMFGTEFRYQDFQFSDFTDPSGYFNYLEFMLNLAQEHQLSMTRSRMLMSNDLVYVTVAGMPLKLSLHGAASLHLDLSGHADLRSIFSSPHHLDLVGNIKPSGAITFNTEIGVDAYVATTGLKMVTSVQTATAANVNMQIHNGNEISFNFDMPQESVDIINVANHLYLTKNNQAVDFYPYPDEQYTWEECTGEAYTAVTGMQLCGELDFPRVFHQETAPWFPFTGASHMSLRMNKMEDFTGYHFDARYVPTDTTHEARIAFDTPGSSTNRAMSMDFNMDVAGHTMTFLLNSPWKKVDFSGSYTDSGDAKALTTHAIIDDGTNYGIEMHLTQEGERHNMNVEFQNIFSTPTTATGHLQPTMDDFSMAIEATHGEDVYGGDFSWTGGWDATTHSCALHMRSPAFTMESTSQWTHENNEVNAENHLSWQYTEQYQVDTTLHVTTVSLSEGPSATFRMEFWDDQHTELQFTITETAQGDAGHRYTVEANLDNAITTFGPYSTTTAMTGHIQPILDDFSFEVHVTQGEEVYETMLSWTGETDAYLHHFEFHIHSPQFTMDTTTETTRDGNTIHGDNQLSWTYTEPYSVHTTFDVNALNINEGPSATFRMEWWDSQWFQVRASYMDTHQGWWSETRNSESEFVLTSSFEQAAELGMSYTYAQTPNQWNADAAFWRGEERMELTMATTQNGYSGGTSTWDITTPFTPAHIVYTHTYSFANNEVSFEGSLNIDEQVTTFALAGQLDIENREFDLQYQMTSPYSYVEEFDLHMQHSGTWDDMSQHWEMQYNGASYSGQQTFRKTARAIRGSATINIPDTYSVEFNHKGFELTDWSNNAEFIDAGVRYSFNSNFRFQGRQVEFGAGVGIPEEYGFSYSQRGPPLNFRNTGEVIIQGKHYNASTEFRYSDDTLTANAVFAIPMDNQMYRLNLGKSGPWDNAQLNGDFDWNDDHYHAEATYTATDDAYSGSSSGTSPLGSYTAGFSLTGLPHNIEFNANLHLDEDEYTYEGTYIETDVSKAATGILHTPIEGYNNFGFNVQHNSANGQEFTFGITTPFSEYEENEFHVAYTHGDNHHVTGHIHTSHSLVQNVEFDFTHEGTFADFSTSGEIEHPEHTASFNIHHSGTLQSFVTGGFGVYNDQRIEVEISSALDNSAPPAADYTLNIRFETPFPSIGTTVIELVNHMTDTSGEGTLSVYHDDEHIVDLDFTAAMGDTSNMAINIRQPVSATFTLDIQTGAASETANGVLIVDGVRYAMDFTLVNPDDSNYDVTVVFTAPDKEYTMNTVFQYTDSGFNHHFDFVYGTTPADRFHYELEGTQTVAGDSATYDGTGSIILWETTYEGTVHHQYTPDQNMQFELNFNGYGFRIEHTFNEPGMRNFESVFTFTVPDMQPFSIDVRGGIQPENQEAIGTITMTVAGKRFEFYGVIDNQSPAADNKLFFCQSRWTMGTEDEHVHYRMTHDLWLYSNSTKMGLYNVATDLNPDGSTTYDLRTEYFYQGPAVKFEWNNHDYDVSMTMTEVEHEEDEGYHFELRGHLNHNPTNMDIGVDQGLDMKLYYGDNVGHFRAEMVTPSTATLEMYHEMNGVRTDDAVFSLRMNNTHLMHGRVHIRPTIFTEYEEIIPEEQTLTNIRNAFNRPGEVLMRHGAAMVETFQPATDMATRLSEDLSHFLENMQTHATSMYDHDTFYIRTSVEYMQQHTQQFSEQWQEFVDTAEEHFNTLRDMLPEISMPSMDFFDSEHWHFEPVAVTQHIQDFLNSLSDNHNLQYICNMWEEAQNANWVETFYNWVDNFDMSFFERYIDMSYFENIELPAMDMSNLVERYEFALEQAHDYWEEQKARFPAMQEMMQTTEDNFIWALEYYGVNDQIEEWQTQLSEAREGGFRNSLGNLERRIKDYMMMNKTRVVVWQPENWEAQAEVYFPFEMHDLETLGHISDDVKDWFDQMRHRMNHYGAEVDDWAIWDTYYAYKPTSMEFDNFIPPFTSHATGAMDHIMTFDRKFYDFKGTCSYVAARVEGVFSYIINYNHDNPELVSLLFTDNDHRIELGLGFKLHVDGVRKEMPVMVGETSVMREGNFVIIDGHHGSRAVCDDYNHRCTFELNGWYYGKTGGLFGTYDNEAHNDFTGPNGDHYDNPQDHADAWTEGNRCAIANHAQEFTEYREESREICERYFRDASSPFRPCFPHVEHEEFLRMCLNDLEKQEHPEEEHVCNIASFYADECERAGVHLPAPMQCLHCEMPNGDRLYVDEPQTIQESEVPSSADILFVVSMAECNAEVVLKLNDLVDRINAGLIAKGLENNHFGLVGYGGNGVYEHPHTHTLDGQFFATFDRFAQAMEDFPIGGADVYEDALEALEFASRYHFRPGVSKNMILVPCEECEEFEFSYTDVQSLLSDRDINLHMLMDTEFAIDKTNPTTSFIFGVDTQTVYSRKDFGNVDPEGDEALRPHVAVHKSYCTALTDFTNGALFNSRFMVSGRPQQEKKFMDVMSAVIAMKAQPSECQECECVPPEDSMGFATTVCRHCDRSSMFYNLFPELYDNFDNFERQNRITLW